MKFLLSGILIILPDVFALLLLNIQQNLNSKLNKIIDSAFPHTIRYTYELEKFLGRISDSLYHRNRASSLIPAAVSITTCLSFIINDFGNITIVFLAFFMLLFIIEAIRIVYEKGRRFQMSYSYTIIICSILIKFACVLNRLFLSLS